MTMGFGKSALIALLMIAGLAQSARASTTYKVGGTTGWVLGIGPTFYDDWAKALTFKKGDVLDFVYSGSDHNVFEVSSADLASCNLGAPLKIYSTLGGATITLTTPGTHYYICGIVGHCASNMKMTLVVTAASPGSAPAPSPTAAPALSPLAPSVNATAGPSVSIPSTTTSKSGSPSHRSGPAVIFGAIVCAFASLLL